jgi:bisanhydrobacterioruberin hydratase
MIHKKIKQLDRAGILAIFFYVVFGVGILGVALRATRALTLALVTYVLLACAALLLVSIHRTLKRKESQKFIGWCSLVFLATIFLEGLGVNYGLIFGQYRYSDVLGIKVWGVPLLIGINWITVILGAIALVSKFFQKTFFLALAVGVCAFLFDYLLEPAAIFLGLWQWEGPIPVKNYVAWFFIAALGAMTFKYIKLSFDGRLARSLLIAQTIFFIGIRVLMLFA